MEDKERNPNWDYEVRPVEKMPRWEGVDDEVAEGFVYEWIAVYRRFQQEAEELLRRAAPCNARLTMVGDNPLRHIVIHFAAPAEQAKEG